MNTYAAYYVMWGGVDPSGMQTVSDLGTFDTCGITTFDGTEVNGVIASAIAQPGPNEDIPTGGPIVQLDENGNLTVTEEGWRAMNRGRGAIALGFNFGMRADITVNDSASCSAPCSFFQRALVRDNRTGEHTGWQDDGRDVDGDGRIDGYPTTHDSDDGCIARMSDTPGITDNFLMFLPEHFQRNNNGTRTLRTGGLTLNDPRIQNFMRNIVGENKSFYFATYVMCDNEVKGIWYWGFDASIQRNNQRIIQGTVKLHEPRWEPQQ